MLDAEERDNIEAIPTDYTPNSSPAYFSECRSPFSLLTVLFIALTLFKRHLGKKEENKMEGGGGERNNMTSFTIAIAYILLRCGAFIRQHLKIKKEENKERRKEGNNAWQLRFSNLLRRGAYTVLTGTLIIVYTICDRRIQITY